MNANTDSTRYTVIVKDGEVADRDLHPIAPSIRRSCGHNHRTREAAERCQAHLRNRHREATGSWVESAAWYNSQVHEHAGDSMDYLPGVHWSEWDEAEKVAILASERASLNRG